MILPVVTYGDPILRKKCHDVLEMNSDISSLIDNMFDTLKNSKGVGLSANQVDKLYNIFIIDYNDNGEFFKEVFINPLKRKMISSKLKMIINKKIKVDYLIK